MSVDNIIFKNPYEIQQEGKLLLSKTKIRQTQNEIDNLHAIDYDVRSRYKNIMDTLKAELLTNEKDCKTLQHQIEWVSKRRAELQDEVCGFCVDGLIITYILKY